MKTPWAGMAMVVCVLMMLAGASGCAGHDGGNPSVADAVKPNAAAATETTQPNVVGIEFILSKMKPIYFDYDRACLRPDAIEQLNENAKFMKEGPQFIYQIAGHCDERGTQEYNLALGERRALAVRDYLISLGVPADKLVTISYGEEQPADPSHSEGAWCKNRRAVFGEGKK